VVPGGFVAFTGGVAGEFNGWIDVRPGETPTFVRTGQDFVGDVFDAHASIGELVVGAWTGTADGSHVRILRLALEGGRPTWPPLAFLELPDLVRVDGPVFLAWDGEGTGFVVQLGWKMDPTCLVPGGDCRLATGTTAYVLRADGTGLSAEPVMLPYLEYEPALYEAGGQGLYEVGGRPAPVLAARAGRLIALQGPPYAVAAYAVEPR
jgi:hypothetical protein